MKKLSLTCAVAASLCFPFSGNTEEVHLKSGDVLNGEIELVQNGIYSILDFQGKRRLIGKNEITKILFSPLPGETPQTPTDTKSNDFGPSGGRKSSPPEKTFLNSVSVKRSKYATPLSTFNAWKEAAIKADIGAMVECYASFRQADIKKDLKKYKKDQLKKMQSATAQTTFFPKEPFYQGDRAILAIDWSQGLHSDTQSLQFILEEDKWKIIQ